jgi:hypothetical protein
LLSRGPNAKLFAPFLEVFDLLTVCLDSLGRQKFQDIGYAVVLDFNQDSDDFQVRGEFALWWFRWEREHLLFKSRDAIRIDTMHFDCHCRLSSLPLFNIWSIDLLSLLLSALICVSSVFYLCFVGVIGTVPRETKGRTITMSGKSAAGPQQKRMPYEKLGDDSPSSPCLVVHLSDADSELLSYDYFVGGSRKGQTMELRFSSATVGLRFNTSHDVQQILEWVGGKKLYSFRALEGECMIEVVKASDEEH